MPRFKTITIRANNNADETIEFKSVVNINGSGYFTTTLDEETVVLLQNRKIELKTNGRHNGRMGFFKDETFDGLQRQLEAVAKEYVSREMIGRELVLRYQIQSTCSFGFTKDNKVIPNLAFRLDGEPDMERHWQGGTEMSHATNKQPTGASIYVKPFWKITYEYRNGRQVFEYKGLSSYESPAIENKDYFLSYLEGINSTRPANAHRLKEIPYTEERGRFFVNLYKQMCLLAYAIAQFEEPQQLDNHIKSNLLLPSPAFKSNDKENRKITAEVLQNKKEV